MTGPSLSQTQNWMKTVLTVRGSLQEKLQAATVRDGLQIDDMVQATDRMPMHRRLDIYAAGYVMRLVECLKSEYPILCAYMGDEFFETFAKAYIVAVPSKNWSLYYLGQGFAGFLEQTRPRGANAPDQAAFYAIPAQIARFERAKAEALLAEGPEDTHSPSPGVVEYELACLQGTLTVRRPPCLRLLRLDYPILDLVDRVEQSGDSPLPQAQETLVAVSRVSFQLQVTELSPWQYSFLSHCGAPAAVQDIARDAAPAVALGVGEYLARLALWLRSAAAKGFVVAG